MTGSYTGNTRLRDQTDNKAKHDELKMGDRSFV